MLFPVLKLLRDGLVSSLDRCFFPLMCDTCSTKLVLLNEMSPFLALLFFELIKSNFCVILESLDFIRIHHFVVLSHNFVLFGSEEINL